jgi:hypothetical protein
LTPIHDSLIDFAQGTPVAGSLDVRWIHGSPSKRRDTNPKIQVHPYDAHTFILRQSKTLSLEAPFLFLLCGNERADLIFRVTGAAVQLPAVRCGFAKLASLRALGFAELVKRASTRTRSVLGVIRILRRDPGGAGV